MPLYEFKCSTCKQGAEVLQKYADPSPKCGACNTPMEKQISAGNFHLKGGGWYSDGYTKDKA